jgi:hypothetical protein
MFEVEIGNRVGKWTIIGAPFTGDSHIRFVPVQCDCGTQTNVRRDHLRRGTSNQCINCRRISQAKSLKREGSAWNTFYYRYQTNAKNRFLDFALSKEEFKNICQKPCWYCGIESEIRVFSNSQILFANGVDRIDSSMSYKIDNCVPCCSICNKMKLNYSQDEFLAIVSRIAKKHELK